jgi:hypothetical protein
MYTKGKHITSLYTGYFFSGVSYGNNWECAFIFAYDTKEKEHQNTRQSDLYLGHVKIRYTHFSIHFLLLAIGLGILKDYMYAISNIQIK